MIRMNIFHKYYWSSHIWLYVNIITCPLTSGSDIQQLKLVFNPCQYLSAINLLVNLVSVAVLCGSWMIVAYHPACWWHYGLDHNHRHDRYLTYSYISLVSNRSIYFECGPVYERWHLIVVLKLTTYIKFQQLITMFQTWAVHRTTSYSNKLIM